MLDHYVEMSARGEPGLAGLSAAAADDRVREIVVSKREEAVYARAVGRCRSETSAAAHACAMKAPTPNEWEACVQ
jgi:acid stress-induced BolA-like protein IbaG/YrbA